jgi:hypothetical protein
MAPLKIHTYNKTQLANLYKVDMRLFNKMLEKVVGLGKTDGRVVFTPKEVKLIFESLGSPESEFIEE